MAQKSLLTTLNLVRILSMRIQWGSLVVDGTGKLGGHVAAKNKGSNYLRTKMKPTNPRTNSQVAQRNRNTTNAQGWRALTASKFLHGTPSLPKPQKRTSSAALTLIVGFSCTLN